MFRSSLNNTRIYSRLGRRPSWVARRPTRPFHNTASRPYAQKDSQDKDSLKPRSTEYSKSGSDDSSASIDDTAFDPNNTSPEGQLASASKESPKTGSSAEHNPLDVSPSNPEVSRARDRAEGGAENSSNEGHDRRKSSGKGSPAKNGGDKAG